MQDFLLDGDFLEEELNEEERELQRQFEEENFVPADKEPFHFWDGDYDEETDRDLISSDEEAIP